MTTNNNSVTLAGALAGNGITISTPVSPASGHAGTFAKGNSAGLGLPSTRLGGSSSSLIGNLNDTSSLSFSNTATLSSVR